MNNKITQITAISIILPVYNREEYVESAIISVLKQTFNNYELIIIDDGSTDKTKDILKKYEAYERVRLIRHKENLGPASARNTGLRVSKGAWVAFLDSDDVWDPRYLEIMSKHLKHQENIFVASNIGIYERRAETWVKTGEVLHRSIWSQGDTVLWDFETYLRKGAPVIQPIVPRQAIVKRNLYFTEGCRYGEDLEFYSRLFLLGYKLLLIREPLYHLRITNDALTSNEQRRKHYFQMIDVYERLLAIPTLSVEERKLLVRLKRRHLKAWKFLEFLSAIENRSILKVLKNVVHHPWLIASAGKYFLLKVMSFLKKVIVGRKFKRSR